MKRASAILAILGLACAVLWVNRVDVALGVLGFLAKQRSPVRPNQDITWATGTDPQGRPPGERPPNVVLVLADDLGWNDLTFGGGGIADGTVPRPKIDSIAAEGVNFSNGYAASATCAPSRAALMSGRYGTRFGFEFTPTPPGMNQLGRLGPGFGGRLRRIVVDEDAAWARYWRRSSETASKGTRSCCSHRTTEGPAKWAYHRRGR